MTIIERLVWGISLTALFFGVKRGGYMDSYITGHPWEFISFLGGLLLIAMIGRWLWRKHVKLLEHLCNQLGAIEKAVRESHSTKT